VKRDIVVIGGSAGSIESLQALVPGLARDLTAAVFIVVHLLPNSDSHLPEILARAGNLPAAHAADGDEIRPGRILVAPPDRHLVLRPGRVELNQGPLEKSTRPAIDVLFRSAAEAYGPRVLAVVLSGHLTDGTAGMREVVRAGGLGVVQDPAEAPHPEMPRNAHSEGGAELVLTVAGIAKLIREEASFEPGAAPPSEERPPGRDRPSPGGPSRPPGRRSRDLAG
jgi:two-component system chemotaxis response regulator CheB